MEKIAIFHLCGNCVECVLRECDFFVGIGAFGFLMCCGISFCCMEVGSIWSLSVSWFFLCAEIALFGY